MLIFSSVLATWTSTAPPIYYCKSPQTKTLIIYLHTLKYGGNKAHVSLS